MPENFCLGLSPILNIFGQIITMYKLCLPFILIILGIFDIGKAVVSSKPDDVKKHLKTFLKKVVVCVCVFFIPSLCMIVFGFIGGFTDIKNNSGLDFNVCYDCLFNSKSETCQEAIEVVSFEEIVYEKK